MDFLIYNAKTRNTAQIMLFFFVNLSKRKPSEESLISFLIIYSTNSRQ